MTPRAIQFHGIDSTWVMRITADRRIEVNDDVEVTDAAKKFLEAMQSLLDAHREWIGLTDEEIKAMDAGLTSNSSFYAGALWAEAKLKELNT